MEANKIYYFSAYIISFSFLINIILSIWKGNLFSSLSNSIIVAFFIGALVIERYKIKKENKKGLSIFASCLLIIWFIVNILMTFSSISILRDFSKLNILNQELSSQTVWSIISASTLNFGGFLIIPIIMGLIGLGLEKHSHPNKKLKGWLKGGLLGIASLIFLMVIPSLFDTSCTQSNFLRSWGGEGCYNIGHYISSHISNFISTLFFVLTTGLPSTIILITLFFVVGAGIGYWIENGK
jgi:hypothetical protein